MNHTTTAKLLTALFTLLAIGSYLFLYFANHIFSSGLLPFLFPILPLWPALFYGRKILSATQLTIGLFVLFAIFIAHPIAMLDSAINYRGDGGAGALIVGGFALAVIIPLAIQFLFSLLFLVLHNRELKKKNPQPLKASLVSLALYLILVVGLLGYIKYKEKISEHQFCSDETRMADGFYSQVFFLNPLTKEEVVNIVKDNNFQVERMLLAQKENLAEHFRFRFNPALSPQTIEEHLEFHLGWSSFDGPKPKSSAYLPLLQAYEANEPLVWFLDFQDVPMPKMVEFVRQLDVEQNLLGVDYSGPATKTGSDPRNIQPPTTDQPLKQSKCYKNNQK